MNSLTHLRNNIFWFFIAALILNGCGKNKPQTNYAARVNDAYLGKDELYEMTDTSRGSNYYASEYIRKWIHRELLYQEAVSEGITSSDKFNLLLDNAKKELAAALLLQTKFEEEQLVYEEKDLAAYFEQNKDNFKLPYNSYLYNVAYFNNEDKAILFRSTVIESDWAKTTNVFSGDSALIEIKSDLLAGEKDIHPSVLLRVVKELNPGEISIVMNNREGEYTLLQLINSYSEGNVPPFEIIKSEVEEKYKLEQKEKFMEEFLKELYSENDIEVKN